MLTAKYPIKDTSEFITITIDIHEDMPPLTLEKLKKYFGESSSAEDLEEMLSRSHNDKSKQALWSICAPGFEKYGHSCGIDDLQCLLLSMQCIIRAIEEWEKNTGNKCEYTFYQDIKIVYEPQFLREKKRK